MHDILTFFGTKPELTGINIEEDGVSIIRICRKKDNPGATPVITKCLYRPLDSHNNIGTTLESLAQKLSLKRSRCTTLLSSDQYQLLLTDKPKVPENELATALRWQVKDLIDSPIDSTTFEILPAPAPADTTLAEPAYVLAAANNAIQQRVDLLNKANINLHSIDIHEMALRNLTMLLPEPEQAKALLWLNANNGTLIIIRSGTIYMTRSVGIGMNDLCQEFSKDHHNDSLILEIQRSLDYYESRYKAAPIRSIILAPGISNCAPLLVDSINQTLGIEAKTFNLDEHIEYNIDMPENWQQDYFITIGAALRDEATTS